MFNINKNLAAFTEKTKLIRQLKFSLWHILRLFNWSNIFYMTYCANYRIWSLDLELDHSVLIICVVCFYSPVLIDITLMKMKLLLSKLAYPSNMLSVYYLLILSMFELFRFNFASELGDTLKALAPKSWTDNMCLCMNVTIPFSDLSKVPHKHLHCKVFAQSYKVSMIYRSNDRDIVARFPCSGNFNVKVSFL